MPKSLLLLLVPLLAACNGSDDPTAQGRIETDISIASWDEEKAPPEGKANLLKLAKGDPEAEAIAQAALAKGDAMTVGHMRAAMKSIRDLRAKREATGKPGADAR